jgi:PAS domain S-box-containing protein
MRDNIVRVMLAVFALMALVLVAMAVTAVTNVRRSIATSDWVNHTHAVILETRRVVSSLHAGETHLRNYLLTAARQDQAAYRTRFGEMVEHLEVAKALTRGESAGNQRVLAMEALIQRRIALARDLVQALDQQGEPAARERLRADAGSTLLPEIEAVAERLIGEQSELLRARDKASYLNAQATRWTLWVGLGVNVVLLVIVCWLIRDDIAARRRAALALREANAILEQKVQERTAELVKANRTLLDETLERQWAQQVLESQLHYSDLIINSLNDHILVISKAMNISRVNAIVVRTSGYEPQDLVGGGLGKVLEIEEPPGGAALGFRQALKEGREILERPGRLLCLNGAALPVRVNMMPLCERGKVVGGVLTVRRVSAADPGTGGPGRDGPGGETS